MEYIFLAIVLILFLNYLNSPQVKGRIGERRVSKKLSKLPPDKFLVINDITITNNSGSTSQVDHVVVSVYGIFVIETKTLRGWIHGSENSEYWKQTIYRSKTKILNPIKQNWSHIYAIKNILPEEYKSVPFISIVVFAGSAELKNVYTGSDVVYIEHINRAIFKYCEEPIINNSDVRKIFNTICLASIKDNKAKKEHIRLANNAKLKKVISRSSMSCPKCAGVLTERDGSYGMFYGCSNYPKCTYTKNRSPY